MAAPIFGTFQRDSWGVRFTLPATYFAVEKEGILLVASNSEPGLIIFRFLRQATVDGLQQLYREGIQEQGVQLLQATPSLVPSGPGSFVGELRGMQTGVLLRARVACKTSQFGGAVIAVGLTSEQYFDKVLAYTDALTASVVFSEPPKGAAASAVLAGSYWKWSGGSNLSNESKVHLRPDQTFQWHSEGAGNANLYNQYGNQYAWGVSYSNNNDTGVWSAEGDEWRGVVVLRYTNGTVTQIGYQVSMDPRDKSAYGQAVFFNGTKYHKVGS